MHFSFTITALLAATIMPLIVLGAPIPCDDDIRDEILLGELDASYCCPYGVCVQVGDANKNIQGGRMNR